MSERALIEQFALESREKRGLGQGVASAGFFRRGHPPTSGGAVRPKLAFSDPSVTRALQASRIGLASCGAKPDSSAIIDRMVHVNFNMIVPGPRSDEHPSFPFSVPSLGDVPSVGDYCAIPRWHHRENREYHQTVKVVARRVYIQLGPGDTHRDLEDMIVTLLVAEAKDAPDFRA